jgi:methylenetetrahydrofolate dehydrogenase (NADP+)/methenyltetrahydrofolate cyclohydrolase
MTTQILNGKIISKDIFSELKEKVVSFNQEKGYVPGLAVVIVGDNPASRVYVNHKEKACKEVGIKSFEHALPEDTTEESLLELIEQLNTNADVHGILVQLPLPKQMDEHKVLLAIDPKKDVDGFHPFNVGKMMVGEATFLPCTPFGVQQLLLRSGIETDGKHVVMIGRSNIVGKPMAMIMVQKAIGANATVTICHSRTPNMLAITRQADILIAAIGQPLFVKEEMVKEGVVIMDVGINRIDDEDAPKGYRLVGDVDYEGVFNKASAITPVPGGIGPMTIAMLLTNTLKAAKQ